MTRKVTKEFANFEAKISVTNPLPDYMKLIDEKIKPDVIMPNEVHQECWKKVSTAARETIWKMLFNENNLSAKEQLQGAAEFLKILKEDSAFYQASEYNKWIVKVRDELLKRNMLEFWRDEVVKNELGPCWARDSDLFDDPEDPEPANFYKYADCDAPWLGQAKEIKDGMNSEAELSSTVMPALKTDNATPQNATVLVASALNSSASPETDKTLRKMSPDSVVEDLKHVTLREDDKV